MAVVIWLSARLTQADVDFDGDGPCQSLYELLQPCCGHIGRSAGLGGDWRTYYASQTQEMVSGLCLPVGFKNGTAQLGSLVMPLRSAAAAHQLLGWMMMDGQR